MAINLLGFQSPNPLATAAPKTQTTTPMGVRAKMPVSSVDSQLNSLPRAQAQPLTSVSTSPSVSTTQTPVNPSTGQTNQQVLNSSTAAAQTAAKSIGGSYTPQVGYQAGSTGNAQSVQQPVSQTPAAPPPPTNFNGYLGALVGQQNSQNATAANTSVSGLQGTAQTNPGTSGQAYTDYQSAVNDLNTLKQNIAKNYAGNSLDNVPLDVQTGRAQVMQQQYADQLDAAQQRVVQAQQGLGYQIQGTTAQQAGFNQAGNLALTGQSQQLGAFQQAAGLTQPSPTSYGQTSFSPGTNSFGANGGANLDPQSQATSLAQAVMSNKMTYDQAVSSMGYAGSAGTTFLNNAITSAGGNPLTLQASGAATQSNINTAGTSATNSWNSIYNTANTDAATYSQQRSAINGVGNQAMQIMAQAGINPSDSRWANTKLNQLQSQFSSPQYAAFNTAIQSLQARVGTALQAGEIPTAATSNAQAIADGSITLPALQATLTQIDSELGTFVDTKNALAQYAQGQMQGSTTNSSSNNNSSGSVDWSALGG